MGTVYVETLIEAAQSTIFDIAQDYGLRLKWDPFLSDIKFKNEGKLQKGLIVWVRGSNGMEMTVKYVNYTPPKHVAMKMMDGPIYFAKFSGVWKFESLGEELTKVIFKYKFKMKPMFKIGDWIVRFILHKNMQARLQALSRSIKDENIFQKF